MDFDENLADFGCGLDDESSMSKNALAFLKAYARTSAVTNAMSDMDTLGKSELIRNYLDFCYTANDNGKLVTGNNILSLSLNNPNFQSITRDSVPNIETESRSTLLLIEFFTHCCINCIHSIEDVREVHEEIKAMFDSTHDENGFGGLNVISIHSPKFPREKDLESIRAFCKRMKMDHSEVVNDPTCILWNELGVTCWPTLLILGPNPDGAGPNLLFTLMGEGHKNELLIILKTALKYFQNRISRETPGAKDVVDKNSSTTPTQTTLVPEESTFLKFPGKVCVNRDIVVISDSGNNRLVVIKLTGHVIDIIGGQGKGCKDGDFNVAQFYNPQGIAFHSESIFYIADTGNHSIRKVDLKLKQVTTLISSGYSVIVGEEPVMLMSPWDLSFYDADTLIVAAAGNHRLFGYFFKDAVLFGQEHKRDTFTVVAGSGREENRNNSYIMKASFAQPSGITVNEGPEKCIYIADSESSSIRSITAKGQVVALVGGNRNPTDLFAYGDEDGKAFNVKLQHPMGVCRGLSHTEIFIADTYNHKIKKIDVTTKECFAFVSNGLNEPSGICLDPNSCVLYVADTNHHSIKVIDAKSGHVNSMVFTMSSIKQVPPIKYDKVFEVSYIHGVSPIRVNFTLSPLPEAYEGGQWKINSGSDTDSNFKPEKGSIDINHKTNDGYFTITILEPSEVTEFVIALNILFCRDTSCVKTNRRVKVILTEDKNRGGSDYSDRCLEWSNLSWKN